jgi:uncharacterized membrane protein YdcZ (DUF606 family)
MQLNIRHIIAGILSFALGWLTLAFLLSLNSCATPNPKKQKKHYDKFIYYGGKIDTVKQTVTKEVLVKGKDGKDSLIYVEIECDVPTPKIEYKDRWHIKRMDKQERDSLKQVERILKINAKNAEKLAEIERKKSNEIQKQMTKQAEAAAKQARHENKNSNWLWIVMVIAAVFIFIIIRFK